MGTSVRVGSRIRVGTGVGVALNVLVCVGLGVKVGSRVGVGLSVAVGIGKGVSVGLNVAVDVGGSFIGAGKLENGFLSHASAATNIAAVAQRPPIRFNSPIIPLPFSFIKSILPQQLL